MNEYDSSTMASLLSSQYQMVRSPEDADLIIVNTCSIRHKAEHKLYSLIGRFKGYKKKRPGLRIAVSGCVAQQEGERLFKRMPYLDLVFGPHRLPQLLQELEQGAENLLDTAMHEDFKIPSVYRKDGCPDPVRGFVTIMQGCNNFCTYCIVPYVRGREISRSAMDILHEIGDLVELGVRDITLLGQNVNSYGKGAGDVVGFAQLLRMIDKEYPGIRLRFTTSHPKDISREVMECFGSLDTLCEHLHLPVQAGSNKVLKRMNRHYTREDYLEKVHFLRQVSPEIALTTDLICGFPGETHKDFLDTLSLVEEVRYHQAFAFKYSPRPGTAAARFACQVDDGTKSQRLTLLLGLLNRIGFQEMRNLEGTVQEVLVERVHSGQPGMLQGRTRGNHVVNFPGVPEMVGSFLDVEIVRACNHSLVGRLSEAVDPAREMRGKMAGQSVLKEDVSYEDSSNVCACDNP